MNVIELNYFNTILKGIITGILSGYLLIYGLRPSVQYPDIILELFDNTWIIILLVILNYYLYIWDKIIGSLFLLCIIGLIFDQIIFIEKESQINSKKKIDNNLINIE